MPGDAYRLQDGEAGHVFAANDRINQMLIEEIEASCWRMRPPGGVRTIAAIFAHVHNVRVKWIRLSAPHLGVPGLLNRTSSTPEQMSAGLADSASRCVEMLEEALDGTGRVDMFRRDGWMKAWPADVEMLCYMVAHESHHRGQVCMLVRQLGFPLSSELTSRMWDWVSLPRK